ncbi:AfsA-related hotdog domain-containing protein [Streptomyces sp. NPDC006739]|uniref:AfsA-related hotdog domain-containing protein n=1 Tax=Streptomyces sp. NPDC006739 TaxID=3364763 RepID=UPI0036CABB72
MTTRTEDLRSRQITEAHPGTAHPGTAHPGTAHPGSADAGADSWSVGLTVDENNSFFYDHPLDHIPGMLLVCAMADAVSDRVVVPTDSRVKWVVNFRVMPELSPEPELFAAPPDGGRRTLRVSQGSTVVADSWFTFSPLGDALDGVLGDAHAGLPAAVGHAAPARASLVHRTRPENVMLGRPEVTDDMITAPVLAPTPWHTLASRRPGRRSVKSVVEAGRQFATWLSHRVGGWPDEVHMLWLRLAADLPVDLPTSMPLALRWRQTRMSEDKARLTFELIAGDGAGTKVGSLVYVSKGLTPEGYRAFRAESRAGSGAAS